MTNSEEVMSESVRTVMDRYHFHNIKLKGQLVFLTKGSPDYNKVLGQVRANQGKINVFLKR